MIVPNYDTVHLVVEGADSDYNRKTYEELVKQSDAQQVLSKCSDAEECNLFAALLITALTTCDMVECNPVGTAEAMLDTLRMIKDQNKNQRVKRCNRVDVHFPHTWVEDHLFARWCNGV